MLRPNSKARKLDRTRCMHAVQPALERFLLPYPSENIDVLSRQLLFLVTHVSDCYLRHHVTVDDDRSKLR